VNFALWSDPALFGAEYVEPDAAIGEAVIG